MKRFKKFPLYRQLDQTDCGPTCLRMVAQYYGKHYSLKTLRDSSFITREGVSLKGISEAAVKIGFRTMNAKLSFEQLKEYAILPCILHWNQSHFVVLPPQGRRQSLENKIVVADPNHGMVKLNKETFLKSWISSEDGCGIALLLEPSPMFYDTEEEKKEKRGVTFLLRYLKPYKKFITQLLLGMLVGSILSLLAPFLTQNLVDNGINKQNIHFIYLVLISQLALFAGNIAIGIIRSWLLLHMSSRINISIISDFLIKLMKLPIRFFDSKMVGDITQRVYDHNRIEQFLSTTSLTTLFSLVNLIVFSIVLIIYNIPVFLIFLVGSVLSVFWIIIFMKKRAQLDYARFQRLSDSQNSIFEIITGMQEIKLNDSETVHRWGWERIQAKLFRINVDGLALEQYQMIGSVFFSQLKNILISFVSAVEVLNGNITLGMMLSISYIIGQLNAPIDQLLSFFKAAQDAKISVDRLSEVHMREDEEKDGELRPDFTAETQMMQKGTEIGSIILNNVSFQYGGPDSPFVLKNIDLTIPFGKVTAIVGASGSGKTTLMKILLRFYEPAEGIIHVGLTPLNMVSAKWWRNNCGVVMADGYIFSNTIARNISVQEEIDPIRLRDAVRFANIESFVNELPLGFSTQIGNTGNGISSGQRQRILIARAIYKQPQFIFLDEATSTLDANNEKVIINNLQQFFVGRTVIVIAHRLSTVKHADQIVVMENGRIVELGNHNTLTAAKGKYYELVKNQLELGA